MDIPAPTNLETALIAAKNRDVTTPKATGDITKTAKEFEAMFLSEMLSHMFSGIEVDPMFGGGHGEEMFRSLMVQEYGKQIAEGPGLGISDQIQRMMIDMQQQNDMKGA